MSDLISLATAQHRLGVGRKAVLALVRRGRLPALKVGREWRFDPDDLKRFVDEEKARTPTVSPTVTVQRAPQASVKWKGASRYLSA